jgi:DNA-binding HxlR family transcriptional regulator
MPSHYGQFCPVAKAMELLDERWTLLVIRELMMGSRHFNALRRGVPKMSPALLSKRLQTLVRAGVVERWEDGNRVSYRLTESGRELEPIVQALGRWGIAGSRNSVTRTWIRTCSCGTSTGASTPRPFRTDGP